MIYFYVYTFADSTCVKMDILLKLQQHLREEHMSRLKNSYLG